MAAARRPHWGWHQLADGYARRLVAAAGVGRGDFVLDIGAGRGVITAHLIAAGAQVVAFELHPQRAQHLGARFGGGVVRVVRADATDLRLPRRPFRVVANPPFAITTALLRRLVAPGSRLVRADLVVPFHVARRWVEGPAPGERRWRTVFETRVGARVPSHAFSPPGPPSAVLVVERWHEQVPVR